MEPIYRKEYNEILEVLKHIPSYDYLKIPAEKIEFFKEHSIKDYDFKIDDINNAELSKNTYVIYTELYRDYIATEEEKKNIDDILILNIKRKEQKYDSKKIFAKENSKNKEEIVEIQEESFIRKIINKIKNFLK